LPKKKGPLTAVFLQRCHKCNAVQLSALLFVIRFYLSILICSNMQYRYLGKTGLQVSALSFGSWITFGKQINDGTAEKLMSIAYENGVNFFDNAEIYARGQSEIVMGEILKKMQWERSSWLVSSKVFFGDGGKLPNQTGLSRKHIFEACHASLRRLQVDYIDLYFCHRPDKNTPIAETVWAMNHLIAQGKILYWGTSEWSAQEIMEAHMVARENHLIGPVMEQPQYNMFVRDKVEADFHQIYKTVGLGTTIWSPLFSGVLTEKYLSKFPEGTRLGLEGFDWLKERNLTEGHLEKVRGLNRLAKEAGISLPKLAIAWCLKNPNVSTAILGASSPEQLSETLEAVDTVLSPDLMEQIELILQNKPVLPAF
jgi:voltage-dependent potassium channel beta subunit